MSRKKLFCGIVSAAILMFAASLHAFAVDVFIDGEKVIYDDNTGYPVIKEGRTMVPLRRTMESFGAEVRWDGETSTAMVTLNETTVCCPIGENNIYRNGTRIPNETGAEIVDGRTYLPIRVVLEAFDANVGYDGNVIVQRPEKYNLVKTLESGNTQVASYWQAWTSALGLKESGKYNEAIEAFKALVPTIKAREGDVNLAMLYNHLGFCYESIGNGDLAAACFERESQLWDSAGDHQAAIAAHRKAKYSGTMVQIYATTVNENYNARKVFDEGMNADCGVYLGVTLKYSSMAYADEFENYAGMSPATGVLYSFSSEHPSTYRNALDAAKTAGFPIQFAIQPDDFASLASITENDSRYIAFAKEFCDSGADIYVRFACEMNDPSNPIYTEDYELYKQKFRYVADIFHQYAPNCKMVWSPNFSPEDNMEYYYPGDKYVDYVGISAYFEYMPDIDPLNEGKDRNRFAMIPDKIVSLYGHKKPIIISECGASYFHHKTGTDITDIASGQMYEFLTYVPIKYNQVRVLYIFDDLDVNYTRMFELCNNETYRNAVRNGLSSGYYIDNPEGKTETPCYTFELGNNTAVPAEKVKLHSFIKTLHDDYSYIAYLVNGTEVGVSYGIPYTVEADFAPYKGQTVTLTCLAFDSQQRMCASRSIKVRVE